METFTWIREQYDTLCKTTDPRIAKWPLMSGPALPTLIMSLYLSFVYFGPKWMANRKPLQLKPVLIVYNFSMVLFNLYIVIEMLLGGWLYEYTLGCQPVDYSNSPTALRMANAVWLFFITKLIELLDTVFFILRKKGGQVTFLHVFHHGAIPMFWWWGVQRVPGGFGTFHGLVNAFVHVVMYSYYGLAILGPQVQKYLWWKRYVTILQLSQFVIVTLHNSQYLFMECSYPRVFVVCIQGLTTIVAVLFLNFYVQTYRKRPARKQTANGSVQNGSAHTNGYVKDYFGQGHSNGVQSEVKRRH